MHIEKYLALQGWWRRGLAALLGVCAAAALPPIYILPLLIPAFAGLFLLVRGAQSRSQAFADGWWWGLGHFTAGLYWICISLFVPPQEFLWLTPVVLFGLPSVLSVYTGLVTLTLYHPRGAWGAMRVVWFAWLWVIAEYLRAHLFTGFPWNLTGYVWTASDVTLQFASVVGVYGLSWITVLITTMPALFLIPNERAKWPNICTAMLLMCMALFGWQRLETHPTRFTNVNVRIVQPNIAQSTKWEPKQANEGLQKIIEITNRTGIESAKLVLWPETAVPFYIMPRTRLTQSLGSILPQGSLLITGGLRSNADHTQAWNSVFAIANGGNVVAEYDKHHLVPFGEYIPLRNLFFVKPIVDRIAPTMGDFSRGPGPGTLRIDPYPSFSPLVCYEAIFPGEATDGKEKAQWLMSLTDDAWFGVSTGPYQDAQMARTRAVEQGLPLLRAANTGISAAFDAYGRTLAELPMEKEGVLDFSLPRGEAQEAIFASYPQACILLMIVISGGFLFFRPKNTQTLYTTTNYNCIVS